MPNLNPKSISERIDAYDRYHTLDVRDRSDSMLVIAAEIDNFVASLSSPNELIFKPLGERWHEINESEARYTLEYILSHDIAYGTPEIPETEANDIVNEFLELFAGNRRFFSNGKFHKETGNWSGYGFVTDATCETGVVVVGTARIGILWCHDED